MAYKVTSLIVFAVCHGQHARGASKDVTHIGKAMPKAFVPTGHMPRRSGSMLVNRADAVAQAKSGAAPTFRFPVHEAPSSNQFDSALRMQGAPMNKQSEEQTEVVQHLRARVQPMPQADAKDAKYRFGFGILMFLMVSVGLVASIGTAVAQQYLARVQQTLESTIPGSVSSDTNNRTKQKWRVWIWQTQHDRCPKPSLLARSRKNSRRKKISQNKRRRIEKLKRRRFRIAFEIVLQIVLRDIQHFTKNSEEVGVLVGPKSPGSTESPDLCVPQVAKGKKEEEEQKYSEENRLDKMSPTVVSISNPKTGQSVTLIGVVHYNVYCIQHVKRLIEELQPEAVMIELDPGRVGGKTGEIRVARVTDSEDIDVPISASPAMGSEDIDVPISASAAMDKDLVGILRKAFLENFNAEDAEDFFLGPLDASSDDSSDGWANANANVMAAGQKTGGECEFLQAIRSAEDCTVCDCEMLQAIRSAEDCTVCDTVILGDCSYETPYGRLAELAIENIEFLMSERMSRLEHKVRKKLLREKGEDVNDDCTVDEVEFETAMLKAHQQVRRVYNMSAGNWCGSGPAFNQAFMKERDYLMSESIRRELERRPEEVKTVVGVVGEDHVLGMERHLKAVFSGEPAPLEQDIAVAATK